MLLVGGALYGGFAMQLFGLAAAYANDYAEADEFVAISGGLLLNEEFVGIARPRSMMLILRTDPRNLLKRKKQQ